MWENHIIMIGMVNTNARESYRRKKNITEDINENKV